MEILLSHGADINAAGWKGYDVLGVALKGGHARIGQMLLQHGARIEKQRSYGSLFRAIYYGQKDVVRLLLDNGAAMDWLSESDMQVLEITPESHIMEILDMIKGYDQIQHEGSFHR